MTSPIRTLTYVEVMRLLPLTAQLDGSGEPIPALVEPEEWNGWLRPLVTIRDFLDTFSEAIVSEQFGAVRWQNEGEDLAEFAPLVRHPDDGRLWVDLRESGICWEPGICLICKGADLDCPTCGDTGNGSEHDHTELLKVRGQWW